jgi:hypothetical protein
VRVRVRLWSGRRRREWSGQAYSRPLSTRHKPPSVLASTGRETPLIVCYATLRRVTCRHTRGNRTACTAQHSNNANLNDDRGPNTTPIANAMSHGSAALWNDFLKYFELELRNTPLAHLVWAWKSAANRTKSYRDCLLPKIAERMSLTARYELFRVDSSFCVEHDDSVWVPIVHVESENNAASATHEVAKLSALNAPLNVLIVCDEWSTYGG